MSQPGFGVTDGSTADGRFPFRWLPWALAVLLVLAVAGVFHGALDNGFVNWDDPLYVSETPALTPPLDASKVRWMLTDRTLFYWHPVAYLVHAAENAIWGSDAMGHHLGSVLLHAINALLVAWLGALILTTVARGSDAPGNGGVGRRTPSAVVVASFAGALLFAVHPLRVESVAWASEKKDLLCALFYLGTAGLWLMRGAAEDDGRRRGLYGGALVLYLLALGSKPMAVTGPLLLLLLDRYPLGRWRGLVPPWPLLREKIPFAALAGLALVYSITGEKAQDITAAPVAFDPVQRLVTPLWSMTAGVVKTFWPHPLVAFYPLAMGQDLTWDALLRGGGGDGPWHLLTSTWRFVIGGAVLASGCVAAVLAERRGWRGPAAAWWGYLLLTLPVGGIRRLASIETGDRFSYLPTVGLFLLAGGAVLLVMERARTAGDLRVPAAVFALVAGAAGAFGALTVRQVETWRDSETLWETVLACHPRRSYHALTNLGTCYQARSGRLAKEGRTKEADRYLEMAAVQYERAVVASPNSPQAHANLGVVRALQGRATEALRSLEHSVALAPRLGEARAQLAALYLWLGRRRDAQREYEAAKAVGTTSRSDLLERLRVALELPGGEAMGNLPILPVPPARGTGDSR